MSAGAVRGAPRRLLQAWRLGGCTAASHAAGCSAALAASSAASRDQLSLPAPAPCVPAKYRRRIVTTHLLYCMLSTQHAHCVLTHFAASL
jgi:hypothetical protein